MIKERLEILRKLMLDEGISMYIIPTSDYHDSEYIGDYFRAREFMSGFTGSAGTLLVSLTEAKLWTDGRYFLQAADQLINTSVDLMKMGEEGVPTLSEYIKDNIKEGETIGFDGRVFSCASGKQIESAAQAAGAHIRFDLDLVDRIWTDRPAISANKVIELDISLTGRSSSDKLADIREKMSLCHCDYHILTSLDDIAWVLNMRGNDVTCNPVFLSYMIICPDKVVLFANTEVFEEHKSYLASINCEVLPYNDIYTYVTGLERGASILIDEAKLNYSLFCILDNLYELKNEPNPSTLMKSCKNSTETDNLRKCNITDGVAMVRFLHWLDQNVSSGTITEISAADKLEEFRAEGAGYMELSFETISGYNAHGAIIHYEPTPETDIPVEPHGFLLVDSGAQYMNGTTDITRTIAVGPLTEEMKHHYTTVLRSNLNLAAARFKEGCTGANLDILARGPFWDEYEDYNHGTGHGVGYFLNVHEGPQSFHYNTARKSTLTPLAEGMVITDEPGIYIEGKYGIRIENDLLCLKDLSNEYGHFMRFEALTLCPIDLRPINWNEMTRKEINSLRAYHERVVELLGPHLNEDDLTWLKNAVKMPENI